ncbi:MAG: F0F1 ATP synthase subunit B [Candidatus Nanopelagicales bacterium]
MSLLAAAEEGGNSVLSVPLDELILGTLAFLIVFFLLAKLALPGIRKTLDERADAIEGGIKRAEDAQAEAQSTLEAYRAQLAQAREEAAAIRAQAQADRQSIIEEARTEAAAAAAAVTARAEAQMEAERSQTMSTLKREVGALAMTLADKIVGESLTDDARARATVDRFLADLETSAGTTTGETGR